MTHVEYLKQGGGKNDQVAAHCSALSSGPVLQEPEQPSLLSHSILRQVIVFMISLLCKENMGMDRRECYKEYNFSFKFSSLNKINRFNPIFSSY